MTAQARTDGNAVAWERARRLAHAAGAARPLAPADVDLADGDGCVLARDVLALTDLPAFDCASVDGYAVRGEAPWQVVGQAPAGGVCPPIGRDGAAVLIATGAMVPADVQAILRIEDARELPDGRIEGSPRPRREWRLHGEQAERGELLVPAGTVVTPAVMGVAASAGHDRLSVRPRPRLTLVLLGDEVATAGPSGDGRVRDAIGPQIPAWARRLGLEVAAVIGPVADTAAAHRKALAAALDTGADLIATSGGTMYGPADHLRPTLAELGADYLVETVRSRPGRPMLLARVPGGAGPGDGPGTLVVGLPGRPQPAVLALLTLVAPAAAGLTGRPLPPLRRVVAGEAIRGRGAQTRLALVRLGEDGRAHPVERTRSAALHGMVGTVGFAVVEPGADAEAGDELPLLALPLDPV